MRRLFVSLVAVLLAGCASGDIDETPAEPRPSEASVAIPENLYQPTLHAIVAISGGFGSAASGEAIETRWRRSGTELSFSLELSPEQATVQTLLAGRYELAGVTVDGRELLLKGEDGLVSPVSNVVLDPGDVVYLGDLMFDEGASKQKSKDRKMVLRIRSNPSRARAAITAKFGAQGAQMRTRLLRRR